MRRFVVRILAGIGFSTVVAFLVVGVALWQVAGRRPALPAAIILHADLTGGLVEGPTGEPLARLLFGGRKTLRDVLDALERAGGDPRVKGAYIRIGDDAIGLARIQEVRDAIGAFRSTGKFAVAFADTFGELGPGTRPYYLATACDEIWLQPMGSVGFTGLAAEVPFLRGTLDRLGIVARFAHREEYKSAVNSLTETGMTAPQREETEALLTSMSGQIVRGVAAARGISEAEAGALMDRGPFFAEEAKRARLVDRIGYHDEAISRLRERAGADTKLVTLARYLDGAGRPHRKGERIALIYGTGLITRGSGAEKPFLANQKTGARAISRGLREARKDAKVRAILLRIDSPGGSAVAAETIWREVARTRESGKPVIVTMGDTAASGGYYIAAAADKIVAEPATLTGSIGVLAGKLVVSGLLDKLGIAVDSVQRGANARMSSLVEDFSPAERQRLEALLDLTYQGFKAHVAAGRHMAPDAVEAVAKGRVWSGEEALGKGLVDALGGYRVALGLAKEAAGIAPAAPIELVVFPRPKGSFERLYERLVNPDGDVAGATVGRSLALLRSLFAGLDALAGDRGRLQMPPFDIY